MGRQANRFGAKVRSAAQDRVEKWVSGCCCCCWADYNIHTQNIKYLLFSAAAGGQVLRNNSNAIKLFVEGAIRSCYSSSVWTWNLKANRSRDRKDKWEKVVDCRAQQLLVLAKCCLTANLVGLKNLTKEVNNGQRTRGSAIQEIARKLDEDSRCVDENPTNEEKEEKW